jgi:signal transduction histidine kinase
MAAARDAGEERLVRLVHDLRTPLTVITGFCELLDRQADKLTEEQRKEYLHRVSLAAAELRDILDRERSERLSR